MSSVKIVYRLDKSREIATPEIIEAFKRIAKSHGSQAIWLRQSGIIVTDDLDEQVKNFPYPDWIKQAIQESKE